MMFTEVFDTLVPDQALHVLWSLEERGVQIRIDHDALIMTPTTKIPASDRILIRRFKSHLMHLVRGCEEVILRERLQGGYRAPPLRPRPSVRSSAPGLPLRGGEA